LIVGVDRIDLFYGNSHGGGYGQLIGWGVTHPNFLAVDGIESVGQQQVVEVANNTWLTVG